MSQSTRIHRSEVNFFPPCLEDLIPEENSVRALDFYVESLDLDTLGFKLRGGSDLGRPVDFTGKDLLKLLIYGYLNQLRSCRKLAVEATRNLEVIWLLENARPGYWTINQFRKDNCTAFKNVLRNFHRVCEQLELFGKELIAIDGSFFKARNNSSRNFTKAKLDKIEARIDAAIDAYNQALDESENTEENDPKPPSNNKGEDGTTQNDQFENGVAAPKQEATKIPITEPPANLKAVGTIEELEAKKARVGELKEMAEQSPSGQVSLTDTDSRLLKKSGQCLVGHNVQCSVDNKNHLLIDLDIVQASSDISQLEPMIKSSCDGLGIEPSAENPIDCTVDGGYYNAAQMHHCEENGIKVYIPTIKKSTGHQPGFGIENFAYQEETDEYICPAGKALTRHKDAKVREITYRIYYNASACRDCPMLAQCTKGKYRELNLSEYRETEAKIAARMLANPDKYKQRKELAELPFGTMKSIWGYTQFMVTGHPGCKGELNLMGFAFNWKRVLNLVGLDQLMEAIALFISKCLLKSSQSACYERFGKLITIPKEIWPNFYR